MRKGFEKKSMDGKYSHLFCYIMSMFAFLALLTKEEATAEAEAAPVAAAPVVAVAEAAAPEAAAPVAFAQFGFKGWVVGVSLRVFERVEQELAFDPVRVDYREIQWDCWGKYGWRPIGCATNFCCMSGCGLVRYDKRKWCVLHLMPEDRQPKDSDLDYCHGCKFRKRCPNNVKHWPNNGDSFPHCQICNELMRHPSGVPFPFYLKYKTLND